MVLKVLLTVLSLLTSVFLEVQGGCTESSCTNQGEICIDNARGESRCMCRPVCPIKRPNDLSLYVCASDDHFYRNICEMNRTACILGITLKPLYQGKCTRGKLQISLDHKIYQTIKAGTEGKITCDFLGKPVAIQWSKEGSSIRHVNTKTEGNSLIFIKASRKDEGTYVCQAIDNKGRPTTGKIRVTVTGEDPGSKVPNPPLRELCKKNQSYGECSKYVVRWYYDQTKKDCLPFVYSGCGGNENRFKSKQSCAGFCMQKESIKTRVCPRVPPGQSCPMVTQHQCTDDSDCQFGLKCCLDNCIRQCIVPVIPEKPGRCPLPTKDTVDCNKMVEDECLSDSDCVGDNKCCIWAAGCEKVCLPPERQITKCKAVLDLAFLIDSSGSIRPQHWSNVIKFVKDILERFDVSKDGTHVAAITYSTDTNLHFRFNTIKGKNRLAEAKILLNDMRHLRGYTFPYKALQLANKELFSSRGGIRHEAKKVAVVIMHGKQTTSKGPVEPLDVASQPLKDKTIQMWAVGIGRETDPKELLAITSDPSRVFSASSFDDLRSVVENMVTRMCNESGPTPCQKAYQDAIRNNSTVLPRCADNGSYDIVQCSRFTCYCVDENGIQLPNTEVRIEAGKPQCDEKEILTACQQAYSKAIISPELGQHIPRCKENGMYEEVQCEGKSRECWCVDKNGQRLPGTTTTKTLKCPSHEELASLTHCQKRYFEASRSQGGDQYIPWCNSDGKYRWHQCHKSYCFCVNENGVELSGTRMRSEDGLPNCSAKGISLTPCQRQQIQSGGRFYYPGRYTPSCKKDGRYEEVQCHPSFNTCWCVDTNGGEISGTRSWKDVSCKQPAKPLTLCQKRYQESQRKRVEGSFSPWCKDNGDFEPMQCFGPECFCVDDRGAPIEGTVVSITQGRPNCTQPTKDLKRSNCQIASATEVIQYRTFNHKCRWSGDFEEIQCDSASSQCWCVGKDGGEIPGTRSTGVFRCPVIGAVLPKCQREYQEKNRQWFLEGRSIPWCKTDGNYQPYQCFRSYCYCVTVVNGVEIFRSRLEISRGDTVCSNKDPGTECENQRNAALSSGQLRENSLVPVCKETGDFEEIQCQGSQCYCVNKNGQEVLGTRTTNGEKPQCPDVDSNLTQCEREVQQSIYRGDAYVPRCNVTGQYQAIQCHSTFCWCVDDNGKEIPGTRTTSTPTCPDKDPFTSPCWKEYQTIARTPSFPGQYVPQCEPDGRYSDVQCHVGYCFCVDATGAERKGFSVDTRHGKPKCVKNADQMTDCQAKRNAAMQANPNDVPSIPECKPDGTYSDVQCNRMTQECWCADNKGNEILNTRTNGTLRCKNDVNETLCGRYFFPYSRAVIGLWNHVSVCRVSGAYRPIQCDGNKGYCWCVDVNGRSRWNSVLRAIPKCPDFTPIGACQEHRLRVLGFKGTASPDTYVPQCNDDGSYKEIQCQIINGVLYCWCVDYRGKEIPRTRQAGRPEKCKLRDDITPCQQEVEDALSTAVVKGQFTPRCKTNGDYEEVQCNEWTGYCWCVDANGKEITNTKSKDFIFCPGLGRGLTSCQRAYQKAERDKFTPGRFMPRCTPVGDWVDVQCYNSECYCVNDQGVEIYGTRKVMPAKPNCTNTASKPTDCQYKRRALLENSVPGAFIPLCTSDGGYDQVQCRGSLCFCVDRRGNEIQGSRLTIDDGRPQCETPALKLSLCQRQYQEYWRSPVSGRYVPRCDSSGKFDDVQCYGAFCFCVDPNGVERYGTRLLQTAGSINCTDLKKPLTPCQTQLAVSIIKPPKPGRVIPSCNPDGSYSPVQCDHLSKECWCVNDTNGEIPGTRTKRFVTCAPSSQGAPQKGRCATKSDGKPFKEFLPGCNPDKSFGPIQCDFQYGYCWCSDVNGNWYPTEIVRGKAVCPSPKPFSSCKTHELLVLGPTGMAQQGAFIPQCLDSGIYDLVQCDGTSTYCWCVDENGYEEPGTREFGRPNCDERVGRLGNGNGLDKPSETPCHQARQRVLGLLELSSPGLFVPECDKDGTYKPVQCHPSTGYCWCVDNYGHEIVGTRIMGKPTCPTQRNLTACQKDRMRGLGWNGRLIYGLFMPRCRLDGSFEPMQCQDSTSQCWCVDAMGNEIQGTRKSGRVTCNSQVGKTRCQEVLSAPTLSGKPSNTNCDKDGSFFPMQCTKSNGEPRQCWCVDRQGREIPRTRSSGSSDCNAVSAGLTKCQRERQLTLGWSGQARQDAFVPDCSSDGNYENVQCHEASGFCWCVDGNGNEIVGTRQRGRPVCTKQVSRSSCLIERQRAMGWSRVQNGAFVPQCRANGRYDAVQCYKGTCWCVDEYGYELPNTRVKSDTPNCNQKPDYFTPCYQWRSRIVGLSQGSGAPRDVFVPECDSDGVFVTKQCNMWTGYCWCVDQWGNVLADTYTNKLLNCKGKGPQTKCQKQKVESESDISRITVVPVCTSTGGYRPEQCNDASGECWCVDHLGNEIPGTRVKDTVIVCEAADGLTPCQRERRRSQGFVNQPIKGRFIPTCRPDGSYDDVQCQDSGYCWCVDSDGVEVLGTRRKGRPLCFAAASLSKCQKERAIAQDQYPPIPGRFVPKCRDDGSYEKIQCNKLTSECWCVDNQGQERTGTRQFGKPFDCDERVYSLCRRERARALGWTGIYLPNIFIPECKIDGLYEPVQCHAPSGVCWCVNRWGVELPGTRVTRDAPKCPRSSEAPSMCIMDQLRALIWSEQLDSIYGMFSPACEKDGSYKPVQCNDVNGYCWCVDNMGNELWGTKVRGKKTDCSKLAENTTECTKAAQSGQSRLNYYIGRFTPKCDTKGAYLPVQCDPLGYCWCVNRYGQELPRTKVKGYPKSCGLFAGTTACQRDRFLSMSPNGASVPGRFEAQCEQEGPYKSLQCDTASGFCWCVDENGNEIPRTQSRQRKTCDTNLALLSRCQYERFLTLPWTNKFSPTCTEDGGYAKKQCHGEYCWCVDEYGNELHRTRTTEKIDCNAPQYQGLQSVCQAKQRDSSSNNDVVLICDKFGSYVRVQCMEGSPYCWCVDKYGNEIPRTRSKDIPRCNGQDGLTLCQKERQISLGWTGIAAPGQFVPKCKPNGDYEPVQCHGSTNFCWCVNKQGQEFPGTRARGRPECDLYGDKSTCEIERWRYLGIIGVAFPGRFVPVCNDKGLYVLSQCQQSTGYCWCVDIYGREIPNTRRIGKVYCELPRTISACYLELALATALSIPNVFRPVCLPDGNYKEVQCSYGNKKKCWCVDESGNTLIGTETTGTPNCKNPDVLQTQCRLERVKALQKLFKYGKVVYIPQCNGDGGYDDIQCHKGVCWCTNNRGTEIPGTRTKGKPDCKMPACLQERMNAMNYQTIPGRFVPNCKQDGSYEVMQCHYASGFCWCADEFGREIPETRVRGKAICGVKDGSLTKCQKQRKQALRLYNPRQFIPRCSPDGSFAPVQCRKTYCYCVTKEGQEIPGTKAKLPLRPYCNGRDPEKALRQAGDQNCMKRYRFALENFAISRFIPLCRMDGNYDPVQCNEGWYSCWCVDGRYGKELYGTRTIGWPTCPGEIVPKNPTKCQTEYRAALKSYVYGRYVPRCQPDGKYEPMQCHSSLCFCVNEFGVEIFGTREPGLRPLVCKTVDPITACQKQFQDTVSTYSQGSFVPRCMPDGSYAMVQCGPNHYCWCVDKTGQGLPGTRAKGWPACGDKEPNPISMCHSEFKDKHVSLDSCPPLCQPDAGYYPMQCQAGECFCVTIKGIEIKSTNTKLPRLPTCLEQGQILSPCQRQRAMAVQRHVVSRYIPSCKPDGTFDIVQCDRGWSCWCADQDGKELPGTRRPGWPDCGVQVPDIGPCRRLLLLSLKRLLPGRFIPRCKADGSFDAVQCYESVCMCVDRYGVEIPGTTKPRIMEPDCTPYGFTLTPCQRQYQQSIRFSSIHQFIPICDIKGSFEPLQCFRNVCFCVNDNGLEIEGTRTILPQKPMCSKPGKQQSTSPCLQELGRTSNRTDINKFIPRCMEDGSYHDIQCRGLACYCTDSKGNQIKRTRTPRPLRPNCYGTSPTTCQKESTVALSEYKNGRYIPTCSRKGEFNEIQMRVGYSFCVDNDGREVLGTRTQKPFNPNCKDKASGDSSRMRPNRCPVMIGQSPSCSPDQCQLDGDCSLGKTCCFDGCSNQCIKNVKEQEAEICRKEMDLAIAIQSFPNMTRCSWTSILDFLKALVSKFDVSGDNVNVGIVSYTVRVQLQNAFDSLGPKYLNVEEIQRVINNVFLSKDITSFDESLRVVDGSLFNINLGSREKSLKVLLLISDGQEPIKQSQEQLNQVAKSLKDKGVGIFSLTVGAQPPSKQLSALVSSPSNSFQAKFLPNIKELVSPLAKALCADKKCSKVFDIAFVVDASDSIGRFNWNIKKYFIKQVTDNFRISEDGVHVAILTYSSNTDLLLKFNTLSGNDLNSENINKYVDKMQWTRGYTFIDKALDLANSQIFDKSAGMRDNVPKILVVLTDGKQTRDMGPFTEPTLIAKKIKSKGVTVFSVGIGDSIDKDELKSIASDNDKVVLTDSYGALKNLAGSIKKLICKGAQPPKGECPRQWKAIFGRACDGRPSKCTKDSQCPQSMRCCFSGCHSQCVLAPQQFIMPVLSVCEADQVTGVITCNCGDCPDDLKPVCGFDNKTYDNECLLRKASCEQNKIISKLRDGKCDPCKDIDCTPKPYSTCKVVDFKPVCVCPKKCPRQLDLVCGSDGITYNNICLMRKASCEKGELITSRRNGHCDPCYNYDCSSKPYSTCKAVNDKAVCACPEVCPAKIDLVCGSDGVTYDNECLMRQAACRKPAMITVSWKGHCNRCHKYDCSSKPYSTCKVANGKPFCACPEKCPDTKDLVCGSDGVTYDNECKMRQASCQSGKKITVRRKGHCDPCYKYDCSSKPYSTCKAVNDKAVCACPEVCPAKLDLVCGSDGVTYDNECLMRQAACRKPAMITVSWKGHCNRCHKYDCSSKPYSTCKVANGKPFCACPEKCPDTKDLVCGSDGVTYDNECKMRQASCQSGKKITVRRKGHCDPCYKYDCSSKPYSTCKAVNDKAVCACPEVCPAKLDLVCGSDGVTYDNECLMRQAACRKPAMITVSWKGHCNRCHKYDCSSKPYSTCKVANGKPFCACPEKCPDTKDLVCGSDGVTYDNECKMRQASCQSGKKITVRRKGHCDPCYKYDCSSKPYSTCKAVNDKAVCACPEVCPAKLDLVCGSDGVTYDNECLMRQAACRKPAMITVSWKGHCNRCHKYDCSSKPYSTCKVANGKPFCACPEKCPDTKDLVCGSDGVTYDNECKMRQASCQSGKKITVRRKGHCDPCYKYDCSSKPYSTCKAVNDKAVCACPEVCPAKLDLVCGSDGVTYDNECLMRQAACRKPAMITVSWKGHCNRCHKYDCSSKPYSTCKVANGKPFCACPEKCPDTKDLVCGSDGVTYDNECKMRQASCQSGKKITVRRKGHCDPCYKYDCSSKPYSTCKAVNDKAVCACPEVCPAKIDLVCGSDGVTYDNECLMRQAACRKPAMITVSWKGHCNRCHKYDCSSKPYSTCKVVNGKPFCACPEKCPDTKDLVCGSDGVTYDNECKMRQAACQSGKMITVRRKGHCDPCYKYDCTPKPYSTCTAVNDKAVCACPAKCPDTKDLVCGSDGITYDNECKMRQAACQSGKMITVRRKGHCDPCYKYDCSSKPYSTCKAVNDKAVCACPEVCPAKLDLVCGSDGVTYDNECLMRQAACRKPAMITVSWKGHCNRCHKYDCSSKPYSTCKVVNGKPFCACPEKCPDTKDLVCGSDGVTYDNECKMRQAACQSGKMITVRRKGHCDPCYKYDCTPKPYSTCTAVNDKAVCACPAKCPDTKDLVCGSDGVTYDNECKMRQAACQSGKMIAVRRKGHCDRCHKFDCSAKPYSECAVINDKAVCQCPANCRKDIRLVCGSNGVTYNNECLMKQAACRSGKMITVARNGHCDLCYNFDCTQRPYSKCEVRNGKSVCVCPDKCPDAISLVCGTDGVTYNNECLLKQAACRNNKLIRIRKRAHCDPCYKYDCTPKPYSTCTAVNDKPYCACPEKCPETKDLVCGSDGTTYDNECKMRQAACQSGKMITVRRKGHCDPCFGYDCSKIPYSTCAAVNDKAVCVCPKSCPKDEKPVCASDLRTYSNECLMRMASCKKNRMLTVKTQGKCDPCSRVKCDRIRPYSVCKVINGDAQCICEPCTNPVKDDICASNTITYSSECKMREVSCKIGETLTVVHKGKCPCNGVVDLGFLVDSSGSIGRRNWERMKTFIKHIIRKFEVAPGKTHVAVIEYSTNAAVNFKFNTLDDKAVSPSHYDELVEKMKWQRGYTYIDKALLLANTDMFHESAGMREDVQKVLIVVTDGEQTKRGKWTPLGLASSYLKKKGVRIYSMGIGTRVSRTELNEMSSHPERNVFIATSFKVLESKVNEIINRVCYPDPCDIFVCSKPHSVCTIINEVPTCQCPTNCTAEVKPVCGSDGLTYGNECELKKASCQKEQFVRVVDTKPCPCSVKVDLVFVIDSSGSIGRKNWELMKQFISEVITHFHIGPDNTLIAAVEYSNEANVVFKFNTLTGSQLTANRYARLIMDMTWNRGATFIDKGIALANTELLTPEAGMRGKDVPKIMLIITDGHQTKDRGSYTPLSEAIKPIKAKGVQIHSLGIGRRFDRAELQMMASNPLTNVHTASSFKKLKEHVQDISDSFCPEAESKCKNYKCNRPYAHCIEENNQALCRCISCYDDELRPVCGSDENTYNSECHLKKASCEANTMITIASREACDCDVIMDIAFIVDASGSIGRQNWNNLERFLINIMGDFNIGPTGTRVAVVTYSTEAVVEFDFNKLKGNNITEANYKNLILAMTWTRGYTYIDKGLKLAAEKIFTVENGMRPANIPKVALVITDGHQTKDLGSYTPLDQASALLKNKGVHVYSFGIGKNVNEQELNDIVTHPKNDVFKAASFDDLGIHLQKIIDNVCRKDPKSQWHH